MSVRYSLAILCAGALIAPAGAAARDATVTAAAPGCDSPSALGAADRAGRMIVAAVCRHGLAPVVRVWRTTSTGRLDPSFPQGRAISAPHATRATHPISIAAVTPDRRGGAVVTVATSTYAIALRVDGHGRRDPRFGARGVLRFTSQRAPLRASIQAAGLTTGTTVLVVDGAIAVFGADGQQVPGLLEGIRAALGSDGISAIAGDSDGGVLIATEGRANATAGMADGQTVDSGRPRTRSRVLSLTSDGHPRPGFGDRGSGFDRTTECGGRILALGPGFAPGQPVVAQALGFFGPLTLTLLGADGEPDRSFGSGGSVPLTEDQVTARAAGACGDPARRARFDFTPAALTTLGADVLVAGYETPRGSRSRSIWGTVLALNRAGRPDGRHVPAGSLIRDLGSRLRAGITLVRSARATFALATAHGSGWTLRRIGAAHSARTVSAHRVHAVIDAQRTLQITFRVPRGTPCEGRLNITIRGPVLHGLTDRRCSFTVDTTGSVPRPGEPIRIAYAGNGQVEPFVAQVTVRRARSLLAQRG